MWARHGVRSEWALPPTSAAAPATPCSRRSPEAYKTARQKGCSFSAFDGFYLATLGNARGLRLDAEIGTLDAGRWADVVVLDPQATPVLAARQELSESLEDMLFALMMLGDDRAVRAVYVKGEKVAGRDRRARP